MKNKSKYYLQRENYDRYEQISDIIKKLPKQINICNEIRMFFNSNENQSKEQSFNILDISSSESTPNNIFLFFLFYFLQSIHF